LSIVVKSKKKSSVIKFVNSLELFGIGYSWGGFESLAILQELRSNKKDEYLQGRKYFRFNKDEHIVNGIKNISLKARLEEIKSGKLKDIAGNNKLIIDGGHNISASISIANWVKNQNDEVNLIVGMMKDKDHVEFIKAFENIVNSITLIDIPNQDGGITKEDFRKKLFNLKLNLKLSNGIEESIKSLSKNENTIILCLGSLYLAGEILSLN